MLIVISIVGKVKETGKSHCKDSPSGGEPVGQGKAFIIVSAATKAGWFFGRAAFLLNPALQKRRALFHTEEGARFAAFYFSLYSAGFSSPPKEIIPPAM